VIKPDEKTPLSLIHLARIALECGVPPGVFNIVTGDGPEVGARLAAHPDVGKIAFTGSTEVGREIMRLASGTVKKVSLELVGEGATVAIGGAPPVGPEFERGHWIKPTIFTGVTNDMRIAREEIFGPVLSVIRYSDEDEAVAMANDSIYGLSAAVWSADYERA